MTMPCERTNAVKRARDFLLDLLDPKKTPRVPREIRQQAASVLRHYPGTYDLHRASQVLPLLFGPPEEDERLNVPKPRRSHERKKGS